MTASQVVSVNARGMKETCTCHTPASVEFEKELRRLAMHTHIKVLEVEVEPLRPEAMTRRHYAPAKPKARPELVEGVRQ